MGRSKATRRGVRGAGALFFSLGVLGCYANEIVGSRHDAFLPAFEFRGDLARGKRFGAVMFVTTTVFQGKVDAMMDMYDPVSLDFPVRGTLQCGFGRVGIELCFYRGRDDAFMFGPSIGAASYGYLDYDYMQGATPAREKAGGWLFPVFNPGFFVRAKIASRTLLRAEAHLGLGDELSRVEEAAVLIEYDLGAKVRVSAGWRYLYMETDEGRTEMKFDLSGPTVALVVVL